MGFARKNSRTFRRLPPSQTTPPPTAGRVPRHDLDAEASTLSPILLGGQEALDALAKVRRIVRPEHFYSDANRRILECILDVHDRGDPLDITTIGAELRARNWINAVGGSAYLLQLCDATPNVHNVAAHASIVAKWAEVRQRTGIYQRLAAEAYETNDPDSFFDNAREALRPHVAPHGEQASTDIRDIGDAACALIIARANEEDLPIPTKWPAFNEAMRGGFWPGFHSLISATGMGKTQFALDVAASAALHEREKARDEKRQARKVRVYGLEISAVEMWTRVASLLIGIPWSDLFYGFIGGTQTMGHLDKAREIMDTLPLDLREASPLDFDYRTIDAIRYESDGERPSMVVIDYMQLVGSPEDANDDARRTMGKTAVAGREVARKLGIPVIGISSCARAHYGALDGTATKEDKIEALGQGDPRRLLAVAKESGDVEYASDSVLVIGRNAPSDQEKPLPCDALLGIAKGRSGAGGWVKFSWNGTAYSSHPDDLPKAKQGTAYSSPEGAREDAPSESGTNQKAAPWQPPKKVRR